MLFIMPNKWVSFVKDWAKKHNESYMCAMTKPECKSAYREAHPKALSKKKQAVKDKAGGELMEMGKSAMKAMKKAELKRAVERSDKTKMAGELMAMGNQAKERMGMGGEDISAIAKPQAGDGKKKRRLVIVSDKPAIVVNTDKRGRGRPKGAKNKPKGGKDE